MKVELLKQHITTETVTEYREEMIDGNPTQRPVTVAHNVTNLPGAVIDMTENDANYAIAEGIAVAWQHPAPAVEIVPVPVSQVAAQADIADAAAVVDTNG
jgi:hypothetical protein